MKNLTTLAAACMLASTALVSFARASQAYEVDSSTQIVFTSGSDFVVDSAHQHIYMTISGATAMQVRGLQGELQSTISGLPGGGRMQLSPDSSTLYVALPTTNEIAVLDTATLTVTKRIGTGDGSCPTTMALAGSRLYFSADCGGIEHIYFFDLTLPLPTKQIVGTMQSTFFVALVDLAASPTEPGLLAVMDGGSPSHVTTLQANDPEPTKVVGPDAVTASFLPTGELVTTLYSGTMSAIDPHTFAVLHEYKATPSWGPAYRLDVATDGTVVGAFFGGVALYTPSGNLLAAYPRADGKLGVSVPRLSHDSTHVAVIEGHYDESTQRTSSFLVTKHYPAKAVTVISLTKPSAASIGVSYSLAGAIVTSPAVSSPQQIQVTRTDASGTVTLPSVMTTSDGRFSITDKVANRGTFAYSATWLGDETRRAARSYTAVTVKGKSTSITITPTKSLYNANEAGKITIHLGTTHSGRTLSIYTTVGYDPQNFLQTSKVDMRGNLVISFTAKYSTYYTAKFPGDDIYEPAAATRGIGVHAAMHLGLSGYYANPNKLATYHLNQTGWLAVTTSAWGPSGCTTAEWQILKGATWAPDTKVNSRTPCGHLTSYSFSNPTPQDGRIRATFDGDEGTAKTTSGWVYFKITK